MINYPLIIHFMVLSTRFVVHNLFIIMMLIFEVERHEKQCRDIYCSYINFNLTATDHNPENISHTQIHVKVAHRYDKSILRRLFCWCKIPMPCLLPKTLEKQSLAPSQI